MRGNFKKTNHAIDFFFNCLAILNHSKDNGAETAPDVSQRTVVHHVLAEETKRTGVRRSTLGSP